MSKNRPSGLKYKKHKDNPTSFKKGMIPWNKDLKGVQKANRGSFKKGEHRNPETEFKKGQESWNKGKEFLEIRGEKHPNWKGDGVGYNAMHTWVNRSLGKATECSKCGKKSHRIHWANLSHEYKRDLNDWKQLCASCHKIYDLGGKL